jgi:hypothetical protein
MTRELRVLRRSDHGAALKLAVNGERLAVNGERDRRLALQSQGKKKGALARPFEANLRLA